MGTRADFYIGTGPQAEWLGSVAFDGYQWAEDHDEPIWSAKTETDFRAAVTAELSNRNDATTPDLGWPWPWDNSGTTDYAYYFSDGRVSCEARDDWPDMSAIKKVAMGGPRDSIIIVMAR